MDTIHRDYGYIQGSTPPNNAAVATKHSQVYTATHDGAGNRLPHMNRSFISFTWGEKNIEDFNLLATIENNSLQRKLYADFADNVTESNIWDGQIYWSTHYNSNNIPFSLVTDGITENQLDEFKRYFQPGHIEELTLSEHPNRAIYARVSSVPEYNNMLPFEEYITVTIAGQEYKTSTTLYKGYINIEFIMDDPFWHSRANILDKKNPDGSYDQGKWVDANGKDSIILNDKDALKVLVEDGVPTSAMLYNMESQPSEPSAEILLGAGIPVIIDKSTSPTGSRVGGTEGALIDQGHIAFALINKGTTIDLPIASTIAANDNDIDTVGSAGYFYYAGTAPCAPILQFSLTPTFDSNGYIASPRNSYAYPTELQYNSIIIQSVHKKRFTFTTPGIYTGYNQVIKTFRNAGLVGAAWEEIRIAIRNNVKHWAPRAYAIRVINNVKGSSTVATADLLNNCVTQMRNFLYNNSNVVPSAFYSIDCKTGKATVLMVYRNAENTAITSEENAGDMIRSNYLVIEDRNYPTSNGFIESWNENSPQNSHRIYSDVALSDVNLLYKYLYL